MPARNKSSVNSNVLISAAFLMATSAIGPGFLTQTASFTNSLQASFGFVILISILLDIGAQLNIWKIISASGLTAHTLANKLLPGAGHLLTALIVLGGLAFNTGNLAGAGLGLQVLTGWSPELGAILSAAVAIWIFLQKNTLTWMDIFTRVLGIVMLMLTLYVVVEAQPPLQEATYRTFFPVTIDLTAIITLVGGTVGGYISFAGAHRLLDAGITGPARTKDVSRSAITAILLASTMRILLFLAALGVVITGVSLGNENPAAAVFKYAAGNTGYLIFGMVMWSAAITSVVGSAYTALSFLSTLIPGKKNHTRGLVAFVIISLLIFLLFGKPVSILIMAGAINGFILPIALGLILLAAYRKDIVGSYQHNSWLTILGIIVIAATLYMSISMIAKM